MNKINKDIALNIFSYMFNEDIFSICETNKYYHNFTNDKKIVYHIQTRYHPLIFNICDNMCSKCNFKKLFIVTEENFSIGRCHHC